MQNELADTAGYKKALAVIFKKGRIRKSEVVELVCAASEEELAGIKWAFYVQGQALWLWYRAGESARARKAASQ